jgi:hypothetical protein
MNVLESLWPPGGSVNSRRLGAPKRTKVKVVFSHVEIRFAHFNFHIKPSPHKQIIDELNKIEDIQQFIDEAIKLKDVVKFKKKVN